MTPEAVELDLDSAGLASRFLAALIDVGVMLIVFQAVITAAGIAASASTAAGAGDVLGAVIGLVGAFAVIVVWPIAWEWATKGRSVGKMALGLRVVTVEGAPVSLRHCVIRGLVGLVEILFTFGVVAVSVALASKRFRRLGDHLAGTVVLRERGGSSTEARPHRFIPYPGWEGWTERLDVTRVDEADYQLVRRYLLRAPGLPEQTRSSLGADIVERMLPRTGLDEPSRAAVRQWPPDAPLLALAAAYQRRYDGLVGV